MSKKILYYNKDKNICISNLAEGVDINLAIEQLKTVADECWVVDSSEIPEEIIFVDSLEYDNGVKINIEKVKKNTHKLRRIKREKEFKPLDEIVSKQIPGKDLETVENERKKIRDKYDKIQVNIDSCQTVEEIKAYISELRSY